jgi:hypothetical protein
MAPSTTSPTRPMQLGVTKARAWRFPTAFPIASDGVDSTWMYIFQFLFFVLFFLYWHIQRNIRIQIM